MICALSVRQLKPGSFDDFRRAWEPEEFPPGFVRAYHVRSVEDENQVVSFGLFEGTADDFDRLRHEPAFQAGEFDRQQRMAEFVESTSIDGLFEVIDVVEPR